MVVPLMPSQACCALPSESGSNDASDDIGRMAKPIPAFELVENSIAEVTPITSPHR
jgi:hypothetical protein